MNNASAATRNLLKYGIVLALFLYLTYSFVTEYLAGTTGFTLPVFIIGIVILGSGTPEEVRKQVLERLEMLSPGGGYVFNTIHNIVADVPVENLLAMYKAVHEYNGDL